jgi:hypothetical protein
MVVSWDVAPCSLVEIHWRFWDAYCFHYKCESHLWNVGHFLPDYKAQHATRQSSSYLPWEPEISPTFIRYKQREVYYVWYEGDFPSLSLSLSLSSILKMMMKIDVLLNKKLSPCFKRDLQGCTCSYSFPTSVTIFVLQYKMLYFSCDWTNFDFITYYNLWIKLMFMKHFKVNLCRYTPCRR